MNPSSLSSRRRVLKGMMGGAAVTVGLPLLDCFLNSNGSALANGAPLPSIFATWNWDLGIPPGLWEPKTTGAGYELPKIFKPWEAYKDRVNIISGLRVFLDGRPNVVHETGRIACLSGLAPNVDRSNSAPTLDTDIADAIGGRTRFRSIEVNCFGSPRSSSQRSKNAANAAEVSPAALYARIFGPEFKDPNAADFEPDPMALARFSAVSVVKDQRADLEKALGAADRARLDEYFTSLRQIEQQISIELQKPAPLAACTRPASVEEKGKGTEVDVACATHALFVGLLAHALACDQTRVANIDFGGSGFRHAGRAQTHHILTHEEVTDPVIGYQKEALSFTTRYFEEFAVMLAAFDSIREGDKTLLDRMLLMASTDTSDARGHTTDNMPMLIAGRANGRLKTGMHLALTGEPVTRVGLTMQQVLGVAINAWGADSNRSSKTITEMMA